MFLRNYLHICLMLYVDFLEYIRTLQENKCNMHYYTYAIFYILKTYLFSDSDH